MGTTLEDILKDYMGCKKPFKKDGNFTYKGAKAYKKLVAFVDCLCNLVGQQSFGRLSISLPADDIIRVLDDICEENM